jgi:hypothetical protein
VFGKSKPRGFETWHSTAERARVEFTKGDYFKRESYSFPREQFLVDGLLPAPAL